MQIPASPSAPVLTGSPVAVPLSPRLAAGLTEDARRAGRPTRGTRFLDRVETFTALTGASLWAALRSCAGHRHVRAEDYLNTLLYALLLPTTPPSVRALVLQAVTVGLPEADRLAVLSRPALVAVLPHGRWKPDLVLVDPTTAEVVLVLEDKMHRGPSQAVAGRRLHVYPWAVDKVVGAIDWLLVEAQDWAREIWQLDVYRGSTCWWRDCFVVDGSSVVWTLFTGYPAIPGRRAGTAEVLDYYDGLVTESSWRVTRHDDAADLLESALGRGVVLPGASASDLRRLTLLASMLGGCRHCPSGHQRAAVLGG